MRHPVSLRDLEREAHRRLPRFAFDFIAGGAGDERALRRSRQCLDEVSLLPRILTGCEDRTTATTLWEHTYAAPFGVAPTGLSNLAWPGTDVALAAAAERAGVPYVISTPATSTLERLAELAPTTAWFQLYMGRDERIGLDLIDRAQACGISTLVVTADVPVPGRRLRDVRNGFGLPIRLTFGRMVDLLLHPAWSLAVLRAGLPRFANLEPYAADDRGVLALAELMARQSSARFDWDGLRSIRARWRGRLVLKGVLHPADAAKAIECGIDGVVVSNHGGRQLASAPAPVEMVEAVAEAVAGRGVVMLDGGIAGGEDVARALALGAHFVLVGRPFLWAAAALGPDQGARAAIDIVASELADAMGQLGCRTVPDLAAVEIRRAGHSPA